jgi:CheY-like chemotaxis protein
VVQRPSDRPELHIVLADDEPDTVVTLAAILRHAGFRVTEASKGPEVITLARTSRPDALILDIDMPGMSGYTVAREIRAMYDGATPLLICISGKWVGQTDKMLADLAGFNHFLQKPCDPEVLLRLLRSSALEPGTVQ